MKCLLFIIFMSFLSSTLFSQVNSIKGTIVSNTYAIFINEDKSIKLTAGQDVDIVGASNYYYTIKYKDDKAIVKRKKVVCNNDELALLLDELNFSKKVKKDTFSISEIDDSYKYQIDHIRYCALKYHQQINTAYVFSAFSILSGCAPLVVGFDNMKPDVQKACGYGSAGLALISTLIFIDSNKWMKTMYFGPDGFGIKYTF